MADEDKTPKDNYAHGVTFNEEAAQGLGARRIREIWPRLSGECPEGYGYNGIYYASWAHLIAGNW